MEADEIMKAPCNSCGQGTSHKVIATRTTEERLDDHPEAQVWWTNSYAMLECCGCESISLRCDSTLEEDGSTETIYYPPRLARRMPEWAHQLPPALYGLVREIYAALAAESPRLAIMGARTLVDMVVLGKIGDVGPFRAKLEALEQAGHIGRSHRQQLESALDAGSAAAHRGYVPSTSSVNQVMDIVENLLQAVYVLSRAAQQLRRETPSRRSRKRRRPVV